MIRMLKYGFVLLLATACSNEPVQVFELSKEPVNVLTLYKDSTFVETLDGIDKIYTYKGKWNGKIEDGGSFKTIAYSIDDDSVEYPIEYRYGITNGKAFRINLFLHDTDSLIKRK